MTATAAGSTATDPDVIPVAIIGGGPVGLALATELHLQGIRCVVLEPRAAVSATRPRAKTTSARSMELFRRWGLADRLRARAPIPVAWSSDVVFCTTAAGEEITRFTGTLGLDLAGDDLVAEPGQQIGQPVVEEVLRESVSEAGGVQLLLGRRAVALAAHQDDVEVQRRGRRRAHIRAREPVTSSARTELAASFAPRWARPTKVGTPGSRTSRSCSAPGSWAA